jgi:hypothetical protein
MQALRAPIGFMSQGKERVFPGSLANGWIRPSVDFVDGSGNKKPGTMRSQIVPPPALTASATQVSARPRILIDLLLFSVRYLANIIQYVSFIRYLSESIPLDMP